MVFEYDIYLPYADSDKLKTIKKQLIDRFGGLTDTRHKNEGFWKTAGTVIKDEIVIWRVVSEEGDKGDAFIKSIQKLLADKLHEEKILVIKRAVEFL